MVFKTDIINMVRTIGDNIWLPLTAIRNFSIIDGSDTMTSIKEETILDFNKIKEE